MCCISHVLTPPSCNVSHVHSASFIFPILLSGIHCRILIFCRHFSCTLQKALPIYPFGIVRYSSVTSRHCCRFFCFRSTCGNDVMCDRDPVVSYNITLCDLMSLKALRPPPRHPSLENCQIALRPTHYRQVSVTVSDHNDPLSDKMRRELDNGQTEWCCVQPSEISADAVTLFQAVHVSPAAAAV